MNKLFTIGALGSMLLTSCYTNVNQAWFNKQYAGYQLDYHTDEPTGLRGLPPVLYRCGEDWYIAAICSEVKDRDYHLHFVAESFRKRHAFTLTQKEGRPVAYHKITPEMVSWLLHSDQQSYDWFTTGKLEAEFAKAGGEWLEQLPPGARAVNAEFLKYCRARADYVEELPAEPDPWYTYPLAGLTFLCVDVPCSAAATAVSVAAVAGLLYLDSKLDDEEEDDDSFFSFDASSKRNKARKKDDAQPPRKEQHDHHNHLGGKHHHSGDKHSHAGNKHHHTHGDKPKRHDSDSDKENKPSHRDHHS